MAGRHRPSSDLLSQVDWVQGHLARADCYALAKPWEPKVPRVLALLELFQAGLFCFIFKFFLLQSLQYFDKEGWDISKPDKRIKRIGLDFDGVCANAQIVRAQAAKKLYGLDLTPEQCHGSIVVGQGLMSREEYDKLIGLTCDETFWMRATPPIAGFPCFLIDLIRQGLKPVWVTRRRQSGTNQAKIWAENQLRRCHVSCDLEFRSAGEHGTKADYVEDLDCFMDDDERILGSIRHIVPHLFLFDLKRVEPAPEGIVLVRSWHDFRDNIQALIQSAV